MRLTYSPEVVHKKVEDAENHNQESRAELGLEADNNHHASNKANERDNDSPDGPLSAKDEADEEEDQENTAGKLEVHLAVLLLEGGETGESLGLTHPGVGKNHEKTAHN